LIIDGSILARNIGTNEVIANTANIKDGIITNAKIVSLSVNKLTAGTITSKDIVLAVSDGSGDVAIRAGKTDFTNSESGFILGIDDSDGNKAKFYIGNSSNYLNWDGSSLSIRGSLNADDIITGTLNVDRITAGAITTSKLSANAATMPVSAYTSGSISCPYSSGWVNIQSVSITTIGGTVSIIASCLATGNSYAQFRVRRGGTTIWETGGWAIIAMSYPVIISFAITDSPGSGSNTYYFDCYGYGDQYKVACSCRSLVLLESRR